MQRDELAAWLRLTFTPGVGPGTARKLLSTLGLPEQIFAASPHALAQLGSPALVQALSEEPPDLAARVQAAWDWLQASDEVAPRHILTLGDARYPKALLTLHDPPPVLYAIGSQALIDGLAQQDSPKDLAIVGSRHATPQGLSNAREFARSFAQAGLHVVSGMALGIDGAAHDGALLAREESNNIARAAGGSIGSTIAIVGTGLDRVYPKQHHALAKRIALHGLILSEFPVGTPPLAENFPRRNRIIAALSQGTLVVEAAVRSGSLITARQASDMGREVFAIPGSIHAPQSKGCHWLIKQGAKLVESAQDVLEELRLPVTRTASVNSNATDSIAKNPDSMSANTGFSSQIDDILENMGYDPVSLDALIARTGYSTALLQARLLELELEGHVARLPGGLYQRQGMA
jgi:DNA processing protein